MQRPAGSPGVQTRVGWIVHMTKTNIHQSRSSKHVIEHRKRAWKWEVHREGISVARDDGVMMGACLDVESGLWVIYDDWKRFGSKRRRDASAVE